MDARWKTVFAYPHTMLRETHAITYEDLISTCFAGVDGQFWFFVKTATKLYLFNLQQALYTFDLPSDVAYSHRGLFSVQISEMGEPTIMIASESGAIFLWRHLSTDAPEKIEADLQQDEIVTHATLTNTRIAILSTNTGRLLWFPSALRSKKIPEEIKGDIISSIFFFSVKNQRTYEPCFNSFQPKAIPGQTQQIVLWGEDKASFWKLEDSSKPIYEREIDLRNSLALYLFKEDDNTTQIIGIQGNDSHEVTILVLHHDSYYLVEGDLTTPHGSFHNPRQIKRLVHPDSNGDLEQTHFAICQQMKSVIMLRNPGLWKSYDLDSGVDGNEVDLTKRNTTLACISHQDSIYLLTSVDIKIFQASPISSEYMSTEEHSAIGNAKQMDESEVWDIFVDYAISGNFDATSFQTENIEDVEEFFSSISEGIFLGKKSLPVHYYTTASIKKSKHILHESTEVLHRRLETIQLFHKFRREVIADDRLNRADIGKSTSLEIYLLIATKFCDSHSWDSSISRTVVKTLESFRNKCVTYAFDRGVEHHNISDESVGRSVISHISNFDLVPEGLYEILKTKNIIEQYAGMQSNQNEAKCLLLMAFMKILQDIFSTLREFAANEFDVLHTNYKLSDSEPKFIEFLPLLSLVLVEKCEDERIQKSVNYPKCLALLNDIIQSNYYLFRYTLKDKVRVLSTRASSLFGSEKGNAEYLKYIEQNYQILAPVILSFMDRRGNFDYKGFHTKYSKLPNADILVQEMVIYFLDEDRIDLLLDFEDETMDDVVETVLLEHKSPLPLTFWKLKRKQYHIQHTTQNPENDELETLIKKYGLDEGTTLPAVNPLAFSKLGRSSRK